MDPIIIEKNIPIPSKNKRTRRTRHKYDFLDKLVVGDSVELNVLKAPYSNKAKNKNNVITYYGLMNAIHRTQKDSEVIRRNVQNPSFGKTIVNKPKKFTVRTLRLENTPKGMLRVMRLWRIV